VATIVIVPGRLRDGSENLKMRRSSATDCRKNRNVGDEKARFPLFEGELRAVDG